MSNTNNISGPGSHKEKPSFIRANRKARFKKAYRKPCYEPVGNPELNEPTGRLNSALFNNCREIKTDARIHKSVLLNTLVTNSG